MNQLYTITSSYKAPVTMPKTFQDGVKNRLQIIINLIEDQNPQEAIYRLVDFLDELEGKTPQVVCTPLRPPIDSTAVLELTKNAKKQGYEDGFKFGKEAGILEAKAKLKSELAYALSKLE